MRSTSGSDHCTHSSEDGLYATKLEAILDPGVEYNGLRQTFFHPAAQSARVVAETIYETLDSMRAAGHGEEALAFHGATFETIANG